MPDLASAYADTRASMTKIARDLTPEELDASVPACPAWSVKDLVAHVTSIASSLANGTFPPDLNPAMFWDETTAVRREKFVDEALSTRRSNDLDAILTEWESSSAMLEAMMRGERPWPDGVPPLPEWIVLTDVAVHHHDLRGAVDQAGERDSLATGLSLRSYVEGMRFASAVKKLPAFKIVAGSREWVVGEGEPVATVAADPFELARAASGRRNPDQVRSFAWEGDPEPFIHLFSPYGVREDALVE